MGFDLTTAARTSIAESSGCRVRPSVVAETREAVCGGVKGMAGLPGILGDARAGPGGCAAALRKNGKQVSLDYRWSSLKIKRAAFSQTLP